MKRAEVLDFLLEQKQFFKTHYGVVRLGLFGSLARGEEHPHDIDIILEFESGTENLFEKKLSIKSQLESKFRLPVDILRERFLKPYARQMIFRDAVFI